MFEFSNVAADVDPSLHVSWQHQRKTMPSSITLMWALDTCQCTTYTLQPIIAKLSISLAKQMLSILAGSQHPTYKGINTVHKVLAFYREKNTFKIFEHGAGKYNSRKIKHKDNQALPHTTTTMASTTVMTVTTSAASAPPAAMASTSELGTGENMTSSISTALTHKLYRSCDVWKKHEPKHKRHWSVNKQQNADR